MYVKGLRLAGFKSFAQPTNLEFEPGVNVIVGPNGSGKSNVADALSWVLGSQAPSSLRSGSMEDVIFAGSAGRPALGMAEVTLTLDNSDGVLPLEVSEVTITRSTDRSGETTYRINGAPCRLLDIQELLSDTGIGRSIHTVVGQGQLDAVLHARPDERRAFIEEAAQIGKYRRRKDRSLRKIERVDDNLVRLNDVLVELRRAIRPLKRQATAAAAHSELLEKQTSLRQSLAAAEVQRLTGEADTLDVEGVAHRVALLEEELAGVRARLDQATGEARTKAEAATQARDIAQRTGRAIERIVALGRIARERAETLDARLAAETEEGYRERIRLLELERARWDDELGALSAVAEQQRGRAREAQAALEEARAALGAAEADLAAARQTETTAAQALVRAEGAEAAGRATIGAIEARVHASAERRDVTARALNNDRNDIVVAEREIAALERELDSATESAAAAETRLESARERAEDLRRELTGVYAHRAGATARVQTLQEVMALFATDARVTSVLTPLLDRAQEAVRIAGEGEQRSKQVVAEADAEVERIWIEVARYDEELRRLDALQSGAAERLAGARRKLEAREVELAALDDELARAREALAEAERNAAEERAGIPERRAEVDRCRSERERAEAAVAAAREQVQMAQTRAGETGLEARSAEERMLAAQLRVEESTAGIADAQAALEGLAELRAGLLAARARAEAIATAGERVGARGRAWTELAETRAATAHDAAQQAEGYLASLRERERQLVDGLEESSRRRNEAEIRRAESRARVEALGERALEEWGLTVEQLLELQAVDPDEEEQARSELERIEREIRRIGPVNPRAHEEYAELAERERFLEEQMEDLRSSRRDLMKVVHEVDRTIVEVFSQAFADVAREFETVFGRLFPGGTGRLKLEDPNDLLGSGIEVEARPAGKNVKKLSLLSGGERSLVALAFLFAIFRSRPSPFYLLDEVEAALDDINLLRFLGLVQELEESAQILIVTHQKRTMEAADVLYGISMGADGISHVVAKRMETV